MIRNKGSFSKKGGFTLIEMVIMVVIIGIFTAIAVGFMQTTITAQIRSNRAMREQIALRQVLITVSREIRKYPGELEDKVGDAVAYNNMLNGIYKLDSEGNIVHVTGGASTVLASGENIGEDGFRLEGDNGRIKIIVKGIGGTVVTTSIYLRIGL